VKAQRALNPYGYYNQAPQEAELARTFGRCLAPYLTAGERERLREALAPEVVPARWRCSPVNPPPLAFQLAARVGMPRELLAVVGRWRDRLTAPHPSLRVLPALVLGLGDPALVAHHLGRLRRGLATPAQLRAWLAHTGLAGLDLVRHVIRDVRLALPH